MPDPGSELGPVMVEKAIAHPRPILAGSQVSPSSTRRPVRSPNVVEAYRVRRGNASRGNSPGTSRDADFGGDRGSAGERWRPAPGSVPTGAKPGAIAKPEAGKFHGRCTADRWDATALHLPFRHTKVSVNTILGTRDRPANAPLCAAAPVTTAASP